MNDRQKIKKMSTGDLEMRLEALESKIERIKNICVKEQRALSVPEESLISDMEDTISDINNELGSRFEPAQTVQNRQLLGRGSNTRPMTSSNGPFNSLGEQLSAVARAGIPGGKVDHRLYDAATGLSETVSSDGGFLVQQDFSEQLLNGVMQTGLLAPRCNRIAISGGSNGIRLPAIDESSRADGSRWGGVQSYWIDEAAEKTASKPKFRNMELSLKKLVGLCYASDELLQDSRVLETVIRQAFTDEIGFKLDDSIFRGTGGGQPLGIINSGCLVTVAAEGGQAADTVVFENVVKMYSRMPARNRRNSVWLINQDIEPQLYSMSLAVGTGGSAVFLPGGGVSEAPYATLFGRPVLPIEQASTLGDVGDIVLADLSQYVLIDKGGIQADMSIHVQFVYDESVFRFVYRVDGQPAWSDKLTPYQGANDLSPFVTLAAR